MREHLRPAESRAADSTGALMTRDGAVADGLWDFCAALAPGR